jgi:hypothetical protein
MADVATPVQVASAASASAIHLHSATTSAPAVLDIFGYQVNVPSIGIMIVLLGILVLFYRIQKAEKLDFADMITKDGKVVSLTKVLQLIGGITSTWIMIKLTLTGGLTEALFGLYLTYVGAIEGYSKFVSAKYGYKETSVKEATVADPKPPKE